jgi:hypothetical protein
LIRILEKKYYKFLKCGSPDVVRIKAVLFTSRQYKDETYPVMIRVSHRRKLKYLPMKISVPKDQWDETQNHLKIKIKSLSQVYKRKNIEIQKC